MQPYHRQLDLKQFAELGYMQVLGFFVHCRLLVLAVMHDLHIKAGVKTDQACMKILLQQQQQT